MKRLLSILLILCMVLSLAPVPAHAATVVSSGTCGTNVTWTLDDTGLLTISGDGPMQDYSSGTSPFYGNLDLERIVIESGVTYVGKFAFQGSDVTTATIPESVKSIGIDAFYNCQNLDNVSLSAGLESIGMSAFAECITLTSITLPDGLKTIGIDAFENCKLLQGITLPASLTSMASGAFHNCRSLTSVAIPDGIKTVPYEAFSGCSGLTAVTLPNSVTEISDHAFRDCYGLTGIMIPDGVTSIGNNAFQGCSGLTSITIPDGVTSIGDYAFNRCGGLTSITIPDSVTRLGSYAFAGCSGLTSVEIPDSVRNFGSYLFSGCTSLTRITIPGGMKTITEGLVQGCSSLTEIALREGVTSIGVSAFSGLTSLKTITLPDSLTSIDSYAFSGCTGLTDVVIPDSVTSLGGYVFEHCTGLKNVTIPDTLEEAGAYMFIGCTGLEHGRFPNVDMDQRKYGVGWFIGCTGMKSITIPNAVKQISALCFRYCSALTDIYYHGTQEEWDAIQIGIQAYPNETDYFTPAALHLEPHDYADWTETTPPTCTESGAEESVCTICGKTETREIPALGHVPADAGVVTAPTCEAQGYTTHTCTRCGETYQERFVNAIGHDYGAWTQTKAATCTEPGEERRVCAHDPSHIETRPLDELGHDWGDWEIIEPPAGAQTCLQVRTCDRCGATESEEIPYVPHVHEYTAVVTAPTCTDQGYTTYTCSCGDSYVDTYVAALGHDRETLPKVNATCTKAGHTAIERCRRCGTVLDPGEVIPAEGHKTETRNFKKANCTDTGYTGDEYCWDCGKLLKKGEEVPPKGHDWGPWKVVEAATKTEAGQDQRTCTVCGGVETRITKSLKDRNPFRDVSEDAFYFDPVLWAVTCDPQITDGTSETTFSPDATCTRGQVVTFLWRALGCEEPKNTDNRFTDVHSGDYFYKAVLWAIEQGVTDGTSDTTFSPNDPCTRGHVVTFLWRAEGCPDSDGYTFSDVPGDAYYADAVRWAVEWSITDGTTDTTFSPDAACTRGQIVTFLYRDISDARSVIPRLISKEEGISYCQKVFRSIQREYPRADPIMGYYSRYRDIDGNLATYVEITYHIGSNKKQWKDTVLFVDGDMIQDPTDYYGKLSDRYFGGASIRYKTLQIEAAQAAAKQYPGGIVTRDQF